MWHNWQRTWPLSICRWQWNRILTEYWMKGSHQAWVTNIRENGDGTNMKNDRVQTAWVGRRGISHPARWELTTRLRENDKHARQRQRGAPNTSTPRVFCFSYHPSHTSVSLSPRRFSLTDRCATICPCLRSFTSQLHLRAALGQKWCSRSPSSSFPLPQSAFPHKLEAILWGWPFVHLGLSTCSVHVWDTSYSGLGRAVSLWVCHPLREDILDHPS